jgi:twinfilin-like protein
VKTHPLGPSIEKDFETFAEELKPKTPCYIIFRVDSTNITGFEWALLSYVPDGSTVRDRMLYASSRDTVKRQLGLSYFAHDIHGTTKEEFTYAAFLDHKNRKLGNDQPLTATEIQTRAEKFLEIDHGHTREYVHSVKFPMATAAVDKLRLLNSGSISYVQLAVDPSKETIELDQTDASGSLENARNLLSTKEPRFGLFRFSHQRDGNTLSPIVFVYSSSDNAPIKLKMLYSTVKAVANESAENVGLKIDKKIEISEPSEFTEQLLLDTLYPPVAVKTSFSKPQAPGRGKPRLTKN